MLEENSFLTQIKRVRAELKERIYQAHHMLHKRETTLLSELQKAETSYTGNREVRDSPYIYTYYVDLKWDENLEEKFSIIGSIRVKKVMFQNIPMVGHESIKPRQQASIYVTEPTDTPSMHKDNPSLSRITRENKIDIPQNTTFNALKDNTQMFEFKNSLDNNFTTSEKNQRSSIAPINSFTPSFQEPASSTKPSYNGSCSISSHKTTTLSFIPPVSQTIEEQTNKQTNASLNYISNNSTDFADIYTTKINQLPTHMVEGEPIRGLWNIGNTCFMNSVLQCLSHTLPLRQFYVSDEYKHYLNNRGDLSKAFKRVMIELWGTNCRYSVHPNDLKKQVRAITNRFPKYKQHDAHEYMRFLLNELHEEINRASVEGRKSPVDNETLEEACARYLTWEDSRISELFGGMLRSDVCCSVCSNQSTVYIPFLDIALPIPERKCTYSRPIHLYSIESIPYETSAVQLDECLKMLKISENLDEERPYCNKCMKLIKSTKRLGIDKLPRFLVIQLKRFSYYPKPTKLSTPVKFDEIWRLVDSANMIHTYSLYGIVCHSGTISSGHYTSYCKYKDQWRCFDDEITAEVSWEQVKVQEAYILLYAEEVIF